MRREVIALCTALSWSASLYSLASYAAAFFVFSLTGYGLVSTVSGYAAPTLLLLFTTGLLCSLVMCVSGLASWHCLRWSYVAATDR